MKGFHLFLAASTMFCLTEGVSAAPAMKVKMIETFLKSAEGGGFTAKSAAKEARQRINDLKKSCGEDDPDVQALEKRMQAIEGKELAAQEAKQAQNQAERAKLEAEKKAKEAKQAVKATAIEHKAPLPWILAEDFDERDNANPVAKFVKSLGKENKEKMLELDKQLRERIKEDRAIVEADGPNAAEAQREIERYEYFLGELDEPIRMNCEIKIDVAQKKMEFHSFQIGLSNFSTWVRYSKKDGTYYFFAENGEPEYLREKEIPFVQEAMMQMFFINIFCANQNKEIYTMRQSKAAVSYQYTKAALQNNSPNVVIFHPMSAFPKGSMHDSLAKDALACSKGKYPNAVDVIINSNDWGIERNSLGFILRRVCVGWIIDKDDLGKRTIPAKWAQPNQGGNTYGKLELYTFGGYKKFYVK
ncbi:MAG: hypothetical protein IJJ26_08265 [Victivallales bacterium]|nr:hypothetical protein [Victivallales bacterium]